MPPRSFALPDTVWGIDPSTKRVAVGMVSGGVLDGGDAFIHWATLSLMQGLPHARLAKAREALVVFFDGLCDVPYFGRPSLVVVEQPFAQGRRVHPESFHMVGIVLAALWDALGMGSEVMRMGPPEWKARGLGKGFGGADKATVLRWARSACGYTGDLEDEADALGIATAGALVLEARRGGGH